MNQEEILQRLQPAMQALQVGNQDVAESIFRSILAQYPLEVHSLHFLGVILCQKGNLDDGICLIKKSIDLDSSRFAPFLNLGKYLVSDSQHEYAIIVLKEAVKRDVGSFDAWTLLAQARFFIKDTTGAIEAAERASQICNNNEEIFFSLGVYTSEEDKSKAIIHYQKALEINSTYLQAWVNLGNLFCDNDCLDQALCAFKKALKIDPCCFQALMGIIRAYSTLGIWTESLEFSRKALDLQPNSHDAAFWIGYSLHQLDRKQDAASSYYKALDIPPVSAKTHLYLACALESLGEGQNAIYHFEQATIIDPQLAPAYFYWGSLLFKNGDSSLAKQKYQKAIALKRDFAEAYYRLGIIQEVKGERVKAISNFRKAIDIKPDFVNALSKLASMLKQSDKLDQAIRLYQRALAVDPQHTNSVAGLGWCFIKSCNFRGGINYYSDLLRYSPNNGDALFFLFELFRGNLHTKLNQKFSYSSEFLRKSLYLIGVSRIVAFGDSHVLIFKECDQIEVNHVGASTAYNLLKHDSSTGGRQQVFNRLGSLRVDEDAVLLCFGEVDIRANLIKYCYQSELSINSCVNNVASRYIAFAKEISSQGFKVIIYGGYGAGSDRTSVGTDKERNYASKYLHELLVYLCKANQFVYFSLHDLVFDDQKFVTDDSFLSDGFHLKCDDFISNREIQMLLFERLYKSSKSLFPLNQCNRDSQLVLGNIGSLFPLKKGSLICGSLLWDELIDQLDSIVFDLGSLVRVKSISLTFHSSFKDIKLELFLDGREIDADFVRNSPFVLNLSLVTDSLGLCVGRYPMLKGNSHVLLALRAISFEMDSLL